MAFKGDLQSVALGDVLQMLFQGHKEGVLKLNGLDYQKSVYCCPSGVTLLDPEILDPKRFRDIIVSAGLADRETVEGIGSNLASDSLIGNAFVNAGIIDEESEGRLIKVRVEEEIFGLFEMTSGEFEFFDDRAAKRQAEESGLPMFEVVGLVLEAARRIDEWRYLRNRISDLDAVFLKTDSADSEESPEALEILAFIDGRRTVRNIADSLMTSYLHVAKTMAGLVERDKIRCSEPKELLTLVRELVNTGASDQAKAVLKNLKPVLEEIIGEAEDVSALARLFHEAGDDETATYILLEVARKAEEGGQLEESFFILEEAYRIAPRDTTILDNLVKACTDLDDIAGRVRYLAALALVHLEEERYEVAFHLCNEIVKLDADGSILPDKASDFQGGGGDRTTEIRFLEGYVMDYMPDFMIQAHNNMGAVDFLENLVNKLGFMEDPRKVAGAYRLVIESDPAREPVPAA